MKLKVCGMCQPENILEVAGLAPDYLGFIFYRESVRFVGDTFTVPEGIPRRIKKVGVFVNQTLDEMFLLANRHKLDFIQLHGEETAPVCRQIRRQGLGVIKAFRIDEGFDFNEVHAYRDAIDYVLFDTKGKRYGGNGVPFDWTLLKKYDQGIPFFLSGGIAPDLLQSMDLLKDMNLHALDVNSRVEKEIGIKDVELIREFML